MIDVSSFVGNFWFGLVYGFDASTKCVLQNEMPPRILRSNNLYISGVGHKAIGWFSIFNADDKANWLIVKKCAPSSPSSFFEILRKRSYTSTNWRTSISNISTCNHPLFLQLNSFQT